jgi:hypothetical protein
MNSNKIMEQAEMIVDIIMKHLSENESQHSIREAMSEIFQK